MRPIDAMIIERLKTRNYPDKVAYNIFKKGVTLKKPEIVSLKRDNSNTNYCNTASNGNEIDRNFYLRQLKTLRCESLPKKTLYMTDKMPYIPDKIRQKSEQNFITLVKELVKTKQQNSVKNTLKNQKNAKSDLSEICENSRTDPYKPIGYNYFVLSRIHPELSSNKSKNYDTIQQKLKIELDNESNNYYKFNNKLSTFLNRNVKNDYNHSIKLNKIINLSKDNLKDENKSNNENTFNIAAESYRSSESNNNNRYNNTDDNSNKNQQLNDLPKISLDKNKCNNTIFNSNNKKSVFFKSDIFNISEDWQKKVGEKYLNNKNYFNYKRSLPKTNIVEVGWYPKDNKKNRSRIGCTSVEFNILNPSLRSNSSTQKEIDKLNNNHFFKTPLISEYVNIAKPGDNGIRKEYLEQLRQNRNVFHRRKFCDCCDDLTNEYKNSGEENLK